MTPDTKLQLGDFIFSAFEIPERIPFGGSQRLVTHRFPGGARQIQAMGRDDMPLSWSGLLFGAAALERARHLDYLRVQGQSLALTWSELNYTVVIGEFKCTFERSYKLPYTITLEVEKDNTSPVQSFPASGFDDALNADMTQAGAYGAAVGDVELSGLLSRLDSAISAVSSFASANQATINSVAAPLAAVQSRTSILIASTNNAVTNVSTLGGVAPNNPASQSAARLLGQMNSMTQLPILLNLQSVTGRMGGNLGIINTPPNAQTVNVAGGNLYGMAAQYYKDPTQWAAIAAANNLSDPQVQGVQSILIPQSPADTGGVLNA